VVPPDGHRGKEKTAALFRRLVDGLTIEEPVLDVGCASGPLLEVLRERGHKDVLGLDVDPSRVAAATAKGLPARVGDVEAHLDLQAGHYRTIFAVDVVEHLRRPLDALEQIAGLLHPTGRLVITTGNAGSPFRFLPRVDEPFRDPDHIVYFTGWTLRKLLERAGLLVERMETRSYGLPLVGRLGLGGQLFVVVRRADSV
jgi:2-polyprenyl-3-methyl-5-hydroxy-6-metoxy-1,4-benzoquinol methylase